MCPASLPITSRIITRLWLAAVKCKRSIASVAILTAVSKPIERSVIPTSLSIVLGIPTKLIPPCCANFRRIAKLPSPPMPIRASKSSCLYPSIISEERLANVPSDIGKAKGSPLLVVPKIVPPIVNRRST